MAETPIGSDTKSDLAHRRIPMNNGGGIPSVGLGVFRAGPEETYSAVRHALAHGYRHIDTAQVYGNERAVGAAVRDSGVPREAVFVTTKLWNEFQGERTAIQAFERSVDTLGLGAPDLFLLHWPVPERRLESWRALERLYEAKQVCAIGVSNFMVHHLEDLFAHARVPPAVNQIEVSPFLQQRAVRDYCTERGVIVEAYSPLTKGARLSHPTLAAIAAEVGATPAQVMLRWGLQHGLVVLPKSTRPEHIEANIDLDGFWLDGQTMARLDSLEENLVTGWNPQNVVS